MAEYIEREALLQDIEQSVVYTARDKDASAEMRGANKVIERIKCAPVAEPVYLHEPTKSEFKRMAVQLGYAPVVHGNWVQRRTSMYCTYCGIGLKICNGARNPRSYNYCPNCGARMDAMEEQSV